MIDLYVYKHIEGVPLDPFSARVEAFISASQAPHQTIEVDDYLETLDGNIPVIRDNQIPISGFKLILSMLEDKMGFVFDSHLDEKDKAIHFAFDKLLTDRFYTLVLAALWLNNDNVQVLSHLLYKDIPPPLPALKIKQIQKRIKAKLLGLGLAVNDTDILAAETKEVLAKLSNYLGEHQWFGGLFLSTLDLTAMAFLSPLTIEGLKGDVVSNLHNNQTLKSYLARITPLFFSKSAALDLTEE